MNAARIVALAGATCAIACAELGAQTVFWDANPATAGAQGGTGNWIGTNFWFNGTNNQQWVDFAQPTFGGTAGTVSVNGSVAVNGMAFTTSGYLIDGPSTITLANAVINVADPVLDSFAEIKAPLAGTAGLTKTGQGTLIMSGPLANTYTGTTSINGGTLFLSKTGGNAINGDLVIGDNLGGPGFAAVQQFATNQITNTAKVTVNANGQWTSFSQSEAIGALELNGGTVHFEPAGILTMTSVTTIANSATAFLRGRVNLDGFIRTFNVADGTAATDLAMYPVAGGTDGLFNGGVNKIGPGTLDLSGANTFTTLQINGGAISVAAVADGGVASPIGAGTNISFDGGRLMIPGTSITTSTNRSVTLNGGGGTFEISHFSSALGLSGTISGAGALTKLGQGGLTLSGTSSFTGALNIVAGTITTFGVADSGVNSPIGAGNTINLSGTARLFHLGANGSTNRSITLNNGGGIASGGTLELTGPITGTGLFQKSGGGVVILSGVNTFDGNVFIGQSTLRVANGSAIPDTAGIDFNNGLNPILDLNNSSETVGSLGNNTGGSLTGGTITLGTGTLTTGGNNRSTTYNGFISGVGGNIAKIGTGTQTFTQANTFTGSVAINGGAISVAQIANAGTASPLGAGNAISFNGGALVYTGATNGSTDRGVTLNAAGGRLKTTPGAATLILTGLITGPGALITEGFVSVQSLNTFTGPLVVDGGILSVPSVADGNLTSPIGRGTSITINNGAGLFVQGSGTHSTNRSVTISGGASLGPSNGVVTYSGPITGSGGLNITGPGILVLSGTNTFSGSLSVYNSSLRIANGNAIPDSATVFLSPFNTPAAFDVNGSTETIGALTGGSATTGAVTLGNGTLTVGANNTPASFDGVISGTGNLVKVGFGDFTLARASTFSGSMSIQAGTVFVADVADAGTASPLGAGANISLGAAGTQGTLVYTGTNNDSMARNITLNGGGGSITVSNAATTLTLAGPITGSGVFGVTGPGTVVLSNLNNYTGQTLIGQGVLRQEGGSKFSSASAVVMSNAPGSVLDLNNFNATIGSLSGGGAAGGEVLLGNSPLSTGADGSSTTFGGKISGTGQLIKLGSGTMTLSGTNTYTGVTSVNAGTLRLSGGNAIADTSPLNVAGAGTAEFANGTETIASLLGTGNVTLSGGGHLRVGANNFGTIFEGVISGAGNLTKVGTGTLTLSSAPTFTGMTTITAGILRLNGGFESAGGAITIEPGGTLEARSLVGRSVAGAGTITANGTLFIGNASSPTGFQFNGTLNAGTHQVVLADSNSAELGTQTLLGAGAQLNSLNGIRLGSGRVINTSATASATIGGNLTNNGGISGPALAGQFLHFTGDVTGAGNFSGRVRFLDSYNPGDGPNTTAAISLENFLFDSTHTLTLDLGGLAAGSQYDQLNSLTGSATLDGTLTINLISGYQPQEGHAFTLLTANSVTGAFDMMNFPSLPAGLAWDYLQTGSTATLSVIPEPSTFALLLPVAFGAMCRRRRDSYGAASTR